MKRTLSLMLLAVTALLTATAQPQATTNVFVGGTDGYSSYRIPAIVRTKQGTLLAFAEGRRNSSSDTGDIDLVLKRSRDGGRTWGKLQVVRNQGNNVCGNPVPIVDGATGRIVLLTTWNLGEDSEGKLERGKSKDQRRIYVQYSTDDGLTWTRSREITSDVKYNSWGWYATGPCHGIQLQAGEHAGRMIAPCDFTLIEGREMHSHLLYSDDGGDTWHIGLTSGKGFNESCAVELPTGEVMLNMRNYNRKQSQSRGILVSPDGGQTVAREYFQEELVEPVCQGSTLNFMKNGKLTEELLFSNPADTRHRVRMTVKRSTDAGQTWPYECVVYAGPASYSDLVQLPGDRIGVLYEYGEKDCDEKIGFAVIGRKDFKKVR